MFPINLNFQLSTKENSSPVQQYGLKITHKYDQLCTIENFPSDSIISFDHVCMYHSFAIFFVYLQKSNISILIEMI